MNDTPATDIKKPEMAYDFNAWQERTGLDTAQAANTMGVSKSFYLQLKREGGGRKVYVWAAYGIECSINAQRPQKD